MDDTGLAVMRLGAQGFNCSQILMLLALEARGQDNPDLVRAVAGLGKGLGDCSGTCGVLTGGLCVLALYAAKGSPEEEEDERHALMASELVDWFKQEAGERYGGILCRDILGSDGCAGPNPERCGGLVAGAWGRVLEILVENGLDPSAPRGGAHG